MNSSISLNSISPMLSGLFRRYHVVIFALTIVAGISVAVFFLNALITPSADIIEATTESAKFDKETISRVQMLATPEENTSELNFGPGRSNPFHE